MKPGRLILFSVLIVIGFAAGFGYGRWYGPRQNAAATSGPAKPKGYHCPMHPNYRSDKPGECGICGMRLVPDGEPSAPAHERTVLHYHDPDNPGITSDKPGLNPETGNDLVPVYADDHASMPAGTVHISPQKQQLIGVRFGVAEETAGEHGFRASGKVAIDETRIAKVQSRVEGWIDQVYVDFIGKRIEKGQPLLTVYSPEMLATQREYLLALRSRDIMKSSTLRGTLAMGESLIEATRKRLEHWDLSEQQIREIERTQQPIKNVTLYSPMQGYVMARNAFAKQRITPETELYTVVDLSRVWIMADVFESDAPVVREGMPATVTLTYSTGRKIPARVHYIQPQADPATRTLKVRLEADNPGVALKPEMFVDVDFRLALPRRLTVPAEAVLDSGLRKTVFVDRGNGYFEPRQVETGERMGGRVEIVRGLRAGERVVTSGNFLIDSESQLKSAAAGMAEHSHD